MCVSACISHSNDNHAHIKTGTYELGKSVYHYLTTKYATTRWGTFEAGTRPANFQTVNYALHFSVLPSLPFPTSSFHSFPLCCPSQRKRRWGSAPGTCHGICALTSRSVNRGIHIVMAPITACWHK